MLQEARSREASALALLDSRTDEFQTIATDFEQRHEALKALLGPAGDVLDAPAHAVATLEAAPGQQSRATGLAQTASLRGDSMEQPAVLRLAELRSEQERMMSVAAEAAGTRIAAAREALQVAGLRVEDLVIGATAGMGGPLVELDLTTIAPDLAEDAEFTARLEEVAAHLAEAEELERAIASAPFRSPLTTDYRLTSRFGGRVDPLTHSSAYHTGLDMAAYHRAPVVTTATGTVSFSGWKGGYGRTIEIDHGNGFKTRYGHLSQIQVDVGDMVSAGDPIGSMGSTGRSTGTHLHYEVWFQGKVQDPAKFLRAGRYVQQS
jgi:murein DD-endopeptidase MepM/ murein hydrolase activator NlpD